MTQTFEHKFLQQNKDFFGYTVFTIMGASFVTEVDALHILDKEKQKVRDAIKNMMFICENGCSTIDKELTINKLLQDLRLLDEIDEHRIERKGDNE